MTHMSHDRLCLAKQVQQWLHTACTESSSHSLVDRLLSVLPTVVGAGAVRKQAAADRASGILGVMKKSKLSHHLLVWKDIKIKHMTIAEHLWPWSAGISVLVVVMAGWGGVILGVSVLLKYKHTMCGYAKTAADALNHWVLRVWPLSLCYAVRAASL